MPRQYTPRVQVTCLRCETVFALNPARASKTRYCSFACKYPPAVDVICASCGLVFSVEASRSSTAHFCSAICKKIGQTRPVAERLLKFGARSPIGCLLWTGSISLPDGYGQLGISGRTWGAHVAAYREWVGPIPDGHQVHHLCDVHYAPEDITYRRCIEPSHLTTGTPKQNSEHMVEVGRSASGDRSPSRLHPESRPRGDAHPSRRKARSLESAHQ
jgi:hypothetical protein